MYFQKPLKRVDINEFIEAKTTANYTNIQVSDEIIDYLFNTGECGSFVKEEPPKKPKLDTDKTHSPIKTEIKLEELSSPNLPSSNSVATNVFSTVIILLIAFILGYYFQQLSNATTTYRLPEMPPKSTAEFHANWKDLSLDNKFKYLKVTFWMSAMKVERFVFAVYRSSQDDKYLGHRLRIGSSYRHS